jgi:integral membrane sensor domain MASE1
MHGRHAIPIHGPMNDDVATGIATGILMGALAGVMLLRRVLTKEAQFDPRFILVVLGAVVASAITGIVVGSLLSRN